jgi:hypothetical protein
MHTEHGQQEAVQATQQRRSTVKAKGLFGSKQAVARISQSWADVGVVVQLAVDRCGENRDGGVDFVEGVDPLGGCQ